jgi:hypothetical protein
MNEQVGRYFFERDVEDVKRRRHAWWPEQTQEDNIRADARAEHYQDEAGNA